MKNFTPKLRLILVLALTVLTCVTSLTMGISSDQLEEIFTFINGGFL